MLTQPQTEFCTAGQKKEVIALCPDGAASFVDSAPIIMSEIIAIELLEGCFDLCGWIVKL